MASTPVDRGYRLRLFGSPSLVDAAGATPTGLGPGKTLALLAHLARRREVRREELTALLWGGLDERRARNAFRQALHRLRAALGDGLVPHDRGGTVRLVPGERLWIDVDAFERALDAGRTEAALELRRGPFLEGFGVGESAFDHWADAERAALDARCRGAAAKAARAALADGDGDGAASLSAVLTAIESLDADAALLHAEALESAGRVEEAEARLSAFGRRYAEAFGMEPPERIGAELERLAGLERMDGLERSSGPERPERAEDPERLERLEHRRAAADGAGAALAGDAVRRRPAAVVAGAAAGIALAGAVAFAVSQRPAAAPPPAHVLGDTLVIEEVAGPDRTQRYRVAGAVGTAAERLEPVGAGVGGPAWLDSLSLPWMDPRVGPDGRRVALHRMSANGPDAYVVSMPARDTLLRVVGPGDDVVLGWSPDGRHSLVSRSRTLVDGGYDTDLFVYAADGGVPALPVDTAADRAVVDAVWSPTGERIAWTARVGELRQREVFVADVTGVGGAAGATGAEAVVATAVDGRMVSNVSDHPAEDRSPAWSPDGEQLAFASERNGDAEIYVARLPTGEGMQDPPSVDVRSSDERPASGRVVDERMAGERSSSARMPGEPQPPDLWRITRDPAYDDSPAFSADGRFLAFESTRGGEPGVYVVAAGGGEAVRVSPAGRRMRLIGWVGGRPGPASVDAEPGGRGANSGGIEDGRERMTVPETDLEGGREPMTALEDDFEAGRLSERWRVLGDPRPEVRDGVGRAGSRGVVLRADRRWSSGVLSRAEFPVGNGVEVELWVERRPGGVEPDEGRARTTVALVAPPPPGTVDAAAPRFLTIASVAWMRDAGRIAYSAGREVWTEPIPALGGGAEEGRRVRITVDGRGAVAFHVDGALRHRASLRVDGVTHSRVRLWLGGEASGSSTRVDEVRVRVGR